MWIIDEGVALGMMVAGGGGGGSGDGSDSCGLYFVGLPFLPKSQFGMIDPIVELYIYINN